MTAVDAIAIAWIALAFTVRLRYRKWMYDNSPESTTRGADKERSF